MKTILITGSSTGIGRLTALKFAHEGWNVIATMRSPEKETELLQHSNIHVMKLDVNDQAMIDHVLADVLLKFGKIDVLFNNAGFALVGAFEAMTMEQIKHQFETNVFGVMAMTKALLPHFRENKSGSIINTTSVGGLVAFPLYSVYHGTKWALEGFMESLHYELKPFNIKVKNIEPGPIKTEFENSSNLVTAAPYANYVSKANQNMLNLYKSAPTGEVVAHKVWRAANDKSYKLRYPVGGGAPLFLVLRRILPLKLFIWLVRSQTEKGIKK
jgi:short-subunit dehydrogenase